MHGIIFMELQKYVDAKLGGNTWNRLLQDAGLNDSFYLATRDYPDEEAVRLVTAAAKATGKEAVAVLQDFGEFIVPDLLAMHRAIIRPHWKSLDLIENTEAMIHTVVRLRNPGAKPPELQTERLGPQTLRLTYTSPRKLCAVAKGIAKGVGKHFNERLEVNETGCMHRGDSACTIMLTTL